MGVWNNKLGLSATAMIWVLFLACALVACNSEDDDTNPATDSDTDTDTDTDTDSDSDSDTASDTDTDTGTGTDTDTITDPDFDMCEDYPTPQNNFDLGSVIRNYELTDRTDAVSEICELSYEWDKLLIKFNTGS